MFAKLGAFFRRPAVSHGLAVLLTLAAGAAATGHLDVASALKAVGDMLATPAPPTPANAGGAPAE